MKRRPRDRTLGRIIALLRESRGWTQSELADASGISQSSISEYELGKKTPHLANLDRLLGALGYERSAIDATRTFLASLRHTHSTARPEDRALATDLFERLSAHPPEAQLALAKEAKEFQSWALVECLALASARAAPADPQEAVRLGLLAVAVAEAMPGTSPWLMNVRCFAYAHLANALRAAGNLTEAKRAFATADRFEEAGRLDTTDLLDHARVLGMKGVLRREERRFDEALVLFDQALARSGETLRPMLLVSKAATLEERGDLEDAIALLREAESLIDRRAEDRLFLTIRHDLAVFLVNAGHHEEAERLLPEVRELARRFGTELDLVRFEWLRGKITAGLGGIGEAIEILTKVRGEFASRRIWYDVALVSLELATLYLREGRRADVKTLARHLVPIFKAEGVHREALAALLVFRQAAEKDAVTLDLIERVHGFLIALQRDPKLTWTTG